VEALALELRGARNMEAKRIKHELQTIDTEMKRLRKMLASLERRKMALLEIEKRTREL